MANEFDGLGVVSPDVELQAFLEDGIAFIQNNPASIDEIFNQFTRGHLAKKYGEREIQKIKEWTTKNEIPVVLAWGLNAERMPSISVHIAHSDEMVQYAALGDHAGVLLGSDNGVQVVVSEFVPASYSSATGTMIVNTSTTDISNVRAGHILVDAAGEEFLIEVVLDDESFVLNIDLGGVVADSSVFIKSGEGEITKRKLGQAHFKELIDIGIHGHADQNTVLWMYYMVSWLLFRFKAILENRCIDIATFSASDFDRDSKFLGEHIYSRWIRFSGKTTIQWREPKYPNITSFDLVVLEPIDPADPESAEVVSEGFKADKINDTSETTIIPREE
jgi:hypothetical protein